MVIFTDINTNKEHSNTSEKRKTGKRNGSGNFQYHGKLEFPVTTITRIGSVTDAAILSEIGDISKFDSPRKLVAFARLDATITQSCEFEAIHNVMSKRGYHIYGKPLFRRLWFPPLNTLY